MGADIGECKCNCNKDLQFTTNFDKINYDYQNTENDSNNINSPTNGKILKDFVNLKSQNQTNSYQKPHLFNSVFSTVNTQFQTSTGSKFFENNIENTKSIKIQSIYKGYIYRKKYNNYIKQKQIEETNQLIKDLIEQYTKFNLKRAESLIGTKFDKKGYKIYYKDKNQINNLFKYNYGKIFYTKLLIYHDTISSFYSGEVNINNEKHGYGILLKSDGSKFEGSWRLNNFTGWGRFIDYDGTLIESYFFNGKANGKGMKKNINNCIYIGDFINNLKDGYGKEETNEYLYEGEFKNDKKNGNGKLIYKLLNDIYEGEFKDNFITGVGFYTWKNKDTYKGSFINGKMHGKGFYKWPDGGEYYGDYYNNIKEGNGRFKWANGKIFEGQFKNGKPNGFGKLIIGKNEFKVEFKDGRLVTNIKELKNKKKENDNLNNENL